jgi:hypothetical protein
LAARLELLDQEDEDDEDEGGPAEGYTLAAALEELERPLRDDR